MGLWQRFTLIFKSKANKALDKAEDPRETLDYSYQRQLELLSKVRRGLTRVVNHPYLGAQEVFVPPWRFGTRTAGVAIAAPLLGQHTVEVLGAGAAPTSAPATPADQADSLAR